MTVKLKSNLYVGPVNIFLIFDTASDFLSPNILVIVFEFFNNLW